MPRGRLKKKKVIKKVKKRRIDKPEIVDEIEEEVEQLDQKDVDDAIMETIDDLMDRPRTRFTLFEAFSILKQDGICKNIHDLKEKFIELEKKRVLTNIGGVVWAKL